MKKINLSIPTPCHESWDQMTAAAKGRFCASCQKTVIDFTNMSDRQLAAFFKKPTTNTCGRFYNDQLNRDIALERKRIPWIKYFFQFTLPAFLVAMKASAQKSRTVIGDTIYCTQTMGKLSAKPIETEPVKQSIISGKIMDERGNPVSFATIAVKSGNVATSADLSGYFHLKLNSSNYPRLIVSAVGYEPKEVSSHDSVIKVKLQPQMMGEVVITVGYAIPKKKQPKSIAKRVVDTVAKKLCVNPIKNFSVYPNPVQLNSTMKLNFNSLDKGEYTISVISSSGEIIQTTEVLTNDKNQIVDLPLHEAVAGSYFVHVFNRKTAASYSQKIVVQ